MTFISYAQNYEDVMLYRALKRVDKGFYVDVGACDPVIDSVTKAFYELGWRGINVEPVKQWFECLVKDRPDDINLQIAVANEPGMVRLYEVTDTGLSTLMAEVAKKHRQAGFQVQEYFVSALTLDLVCKSYSVKEIHFLKVDVEGTEAAVLASIDLEHIRPWIILVEATEPNSMVENYKTWEFLLTYRGYEFIYFDGLNRFYVAQEHQELKDAFQVPPNIFDGFLRYGEWIARKHAAQLEEELHNNQQRTAMLEQELSSSHQHAARLEQEIHNDQQHIVRLEQELSSSHQHAAQLEEELHNNQQRTAMLEQELSSSHQLTARLEQEIHNDQQHIVRLEQELRAVYVSRSWRITMPMRKTKDMLKNSCTRCLILKRSISNLFKQVLYLMIRRAGLWFLSRPTLAAIIKRCLLRYPSLFDRLKKFIKDEIHYSEKEKFEDQFIADQPLKLYEYAAQVYADLKNTFAANRRN